MKSRSLERRGHHVGLMFVSLGLALFLWIYVQEARSTSVRVERRPVSVFGLADDLVVSPKERDIPPIDIDFQGPQEDLRDIQDGEILPYIDLRGLEPGEHRVRIRIGAKNIPFNVQSSMDQPFLNITIEPEARETHKLTIRTSGAPPAGLLVASMTTDPEMVVVTGAREDVKKVKFARVTFNLATADAGSEELDVELLDAQEKPVLDVSADPARVRVSADLVPAPATKQVPVQPTWAGQLPVGFRLQRYELTPPQIRISAESSILANLASVETEPVNLSGVRATTTVRAKVRLPKGVVPVGADSVSVKVYIVEAPQPKVESPPNTNPAQKPPP